METFSLQLNNSLLTKIKTYIGLTQDCSKTPHCGDNVYLPLFSHTHGIDHDDEIFLTEIKNYLERFLLIEFKNSLKHLKDTLKYQGDYTEYYKFAIIDYINNLFLFKIPIVKDEIQNIVYVKELFDVINNISMDDRTLFDTDKPDEEFSTDLLEKLRENPANYTWFFQFAAPLSFGGMIMQLNSRDGNVQTFFWNGPPNYTKIGYRAFKDNILKKFITNFGIYMLMKYNIDLFNNGEMSNSDNIFYRGFSNYLYKQLFKSGIIFTNKKFFEFQRDKTTGVKGCGEDNGIYEWYIPLEIYLM